MMFGVSKIKRFFSLSFFDDLYKTVTFHDLFVSIFPTALMKETRRVRRLQQKRIADYSNRDTLKVVFFLQAESVWKYDTLYRLMEQSEGFEPIVVVSPFNVHLKYDKNECISVMKRAYEYAKSQNYRCVCAYDFEKKKWMNVRKDINPDIVFFSKPYKDTLPQYHIYKFKDKLTLYAPYGICCIDIYKINFDLTFNNLLWKFLVETNYQKGFAEKYSKCKGDNAMVVGALATEKLIDPNYQPKDVWKPQDHKKKRIIWAPHHTVDYLFNFSNFLAYCDIMLEIAEKYKDDVQFAFKPHPVLKFKLINIWGKEKTEAYYKKWEELENAQLEQGYYMDLFKTSDALIHDCASFTAEYLYTGKPVLFMVRDPQVLSHWNPFGRKCFDMHYHAENTEQIEEFIKNVVLQGQDSMQEEREKFCREYLYPADGVMPSQKIMNYLKEELKK